MSKAFNEDEANRRREEIHQQYLKSQSKIDLIRYQISETINSARRSLHGAEDLCIQLTGSDDNLSKVENWINKTENKLLRLQVEFRESLQSTRTTPEPQNHNRIQNQIQFYVEDAASTPDLHTLFRLVVTQRESKYGFIWTTIYTLEDCLNYVQSRQTTIDALNDKLVACQSALAKVKLLQQEWYSQTIVFGSQEELKDSERLAAGIQWLPYRLRADAVIAEHAQLRALVRAAHERLISPSFLDLD